MFRVIVERLGLDHEYAKRAESLVLELGLAQNCQIIPLIEKNDVYVVWGDWMPRASLPVDILDRLERLREGLDRRTYNVPLPAIKLTMPIDG